MKAVPLHIVDGSTRGPDGLPLSAFARFAERIRDGAPPHFEIGSHAAAALNVETLAELQADGSRLLQLGRDAFVPLAGIPLIEVADRD